MKQPVWGLGIMEEEKKKIEELYESDIEKILF